MLIAISGLQYGHYLYLQDGVALFEDRVYVTLLLFGPPLFYFFSREIILETAKLAWVDLLHFIPLTLSAFVDPSFIAPFAFLFGTGYACWFLVQIYRLRSQRRRFRAEFFFFVLFSILAVVVLIMGTSVHFIDPGFFHIAYANCLGISMVLVVAALIVFPELITEIEEAVRVAYSTTTLSDVDVASKVNTLETLMQQERLYENEDLNLNLLSEQLGLKPHQTSELINTQFQKGFSRYVREHRVNAARRLLVEDPSASILSISLMTGFRSQSNFYTAFTDICGESPGSYRKKAIPK